MNLPTVEEMWRLALPPGTVLCSEGQAGLQTLVSWAYQMGAHPPAFAGLAEGEAVLLPVSGLRLLDDRLTVTSIVQTLAPRGIPALVVSGAIPPDAIDAASDCGLPLFQLPEEADLRIVERDIVRLIVNREAQLDRLGRLIYRELAERSIGNQGLDAIAEALYGIVHKPVTILDAAFGVLASAPRRNGVDDPPTLARQLAGAHVALAWLTDASLDSKKPPFLALDTSGGDRPHYVAGIVVGSQLGGFVTVSASGRPLGTLDRLAIERGALVCAVEISKQRAVAAAEQRLRGDFFDALLTSNAADNEVLARRAQEMGYTLEGVQAVLLAALDPELGEAQSARVAFTRDVHGHFRTAGLHTLVCDVSADTVAIVCHPTALASASDLAARLVGLAREVHERAATLVPGGALTIGVGQPGVGLAGLRRSAAQAQETLALALEFGDRDRVVAYGDLILYHLLLQLRESDALAALHERVLAPLEVYDEQRNGELVQTLHAYFGSLGNVSQAAGALHLHRNSLIYRLDRIREITGLDLDDAEDRFALQLTLKLRPLLP